MPTIEPEFSDTGSIAKDLPCAECGYNLRTLPREGRCPECGKEVGETLELPIRRKIRGQGQRFGWNASACFFAGVAAICFCGRFAQRFHTEPNDFYSGPGDPGQVGSVCLIVAVGLLYFAPFPNIAPRTRSAWLCIHTSIFMGLLFVVEAYFYDTSYSDWENNGGRPRTLLQLLAGIWDVAAIGLLYGEGTFIRHFNREAGRRHVAHVMTLGLWFTAAGLVFDLVCRVIRAILMRHPRWMWDGQVYSLGFFNVAVTLVSAMIQIAIWVAMAALARRFYDAREPRGR